MSVFGGARYMVYYFCHGDEKPIFKKNFTVTVDAYQ